MNATNYLSMIKNNSEINADWVKGYTLDDIGSRISLIWCSIFGFIGIMLRFYRLGDMPLSDIEVHDALLAWLMVTDQHLWDAGWLANSSLVHFSQIILFWITGTANSVSARIISAICGSALIFVPLLFTRHLGKGGVGLTMAMLAVSPSLVIVSRTADGMALALICLVIALVGLERTKNNSGIDGVKIILVGVVLGIMCGRNFIVPFLLIGFILMRQLNIVRRVLETLRASSSGSALAYSVVVLIVLTTFFRYRYGLMAVSESWVQWISGWSPYVRTRSALLIPDISLSNQPLLLLLSVVGGGIYIQRKCVERTLLVLVVCGLLYGLIYPGIQSTDVVWVITPLFVFCAFVALWALQDVWSSRELTVVAIQGLILGSLIVFGYILFGGVDLPTNIAAYSDRNYILVQAFILLGMLILVVALFGVGWSWKISKASMTIVVLIFSVFWSMHRSWNMVRFPNNSYASAWYKAWPTGTGNIMVKTLGNLSLEFTGHPREVDIKVISPYNRQIAWRLREFSNLEWDDNTGFVDYPSVIITPGTGLSIGVGPGYIGQEFRLYDNFDNDNPLFVTHNYNSKSRYVIPDVDRLVVWVRQGDRIP